GAGKRCVRSRESVRLWDERVPDRGRSPEGLPFREPRMLPKEREGSLGAEAQREGGSCPSGQWRPRTARNARTTTGSNWRGLERSSSAIASDESNRTR